jgi:hypothetical protein
MTPRRDDLRTMPNRVRTSARSRPLSAVHDEHARVQADAFAISICWRATVRLPPGLSDRAEVEALRRSAAVG